MPDKTVLDNGVRVVTERIAHTRTVAVGIWVEVGARDEHDLNNGTAHFAEHMFFKGTHSRSAQQIAIELDGLGGCANAFTSQETTCYYASVLDSHLPQLVRLFADLFLDSQYAQAEVEREQQVILQEFSMVEDTPDEQIHDLFAALLWGRHPLGNTVLGSREVVLAMDAAKLKDYVGRWYSPERVLIAAAGEVDHERFCALWAESLSGLRPRPRPEPVRTPPAEQPPARQVHPKDLEQVHLVLGTYGLPCHSPDRYPLLLLNTLLGGNMSSRLFQEIRERQGLAYSVGSEITSYTDSGSLTISLGVDPRSINKVIAAIRREMTRLTRETPSDAELQNAKEYAKSGLYLAADNLEARMSRLARNELCFGREITLEEAVAGLEQVSAQAVTALAAHLLGRRELSMVTLGPVESTEIDWSLFQ